jgi:hypothetical protein
MKKRRTALAALMVFAIAAASQAQSFYPKLKNFSASDKERMDKIYTDCLTSGNNGIVQDALAIVTMMKLDTPADQYPRIKNEIDDLAASSGKPAIRYKAYLAGVVFTNPSFFQEEAKRLYNDPDSFFRALAERLTKTFLTSL